MTAKSVDPDISTGSVLWPIFGMLGINMLGSVCWQPVVTSKKSADNQLYFSNATVYLACFLQNLQESSGILNTVIENLNNYWLRK